MPQRIPPRTSRHGHLHAADAARPFPLRPDLEVSTAERSGVHGGGLTQRLGGPITGPSVDCGEVIVARRLDRGRLAVGGLVERVGFDAERHLDADVSVPGRLLLRAGAATLVNATVTAGSSRVHTDARRQIVLTAGVRAHLGVAADGYVVARTVGDAIEILNVATVVDALDQLHQHPGITARDERPDATVSVLHPRSQTTPEGTPT